METALCTLDELELELELFDGDSLACLDPGYHVCRRRSSIESPAGHLDNTPDELYECWDEVPNIHPKGTCVEEIVDHILAGVRGKISDLSTGITELRKQTSSLLTDFAYIQQDVMDVSSLCKELDAVAARRVQNLDEVIYLNGLIKHLEDVDKEMVLVPCELTAAMVDRCRDRNQSAGERETMAGNSRNIGESRHKTSTGRPIGFMM